MRVNLPSNSLLYNKLYNKRNFTFSQNPVNEEENKAQVAPAAKNTQTITKKKAKSAFPIAAINIPSYVASALSMNKYKRFFTPEAEEVYKKSVQIAHKYKSPTIEPKHCWLASLTQMDDFLKEIDRGETEFIITEGIPNQQTLYAFLQMIVPTTTPPDINKDKIRKKLEETIEKHIKIAQDDFEKEAKTRPAIASVPVPSRNTLKTTERIYKSMINKTDSSTFLSSYFILIPANSGDKRTEAYYRNFVYDLQKAVMIDDEQGESNIHLGFYDEKADSLWKTINMNKDALIWRDVNNNQSALSYLINSLENLIKGNNYGNLNEDNTEIIDLNKYANLEFISKLIKEKTRANEKTGKTTIITGNFEAISLASNGGGGGEVALDINEIKILRNIGSDDEINKRVRLVFAVDPGWYNRSPVLPRIFSDYALFSLPEITSDQAKQYLTDKQGLEYVKKTIGKNIDKEAIERAIELTDTEKGGYPDKVLDLLNNVPDNNGENDSVSESQVIEYVQQMQQHTEAQDEDEDIQIVHKTGKTLADIVGTQMTKDAAQSIVDEIKNNPQTKGYLIYQSDGTCTGSGRKHTAEAIAGEAQIPMIEINAKNFMLNNLSSAFKDPDVIKNKMKTIIGQVKTQAKATKNKTAMVFIENFDEFAGYNANEFAQLAFDQLLTEMQNTQKQKDVNLIVIGSVNEPWVIDRNIMKPDGFMYEIIIYPPQDNYEREDLIRHLIKKSNLNISGDEKEQDKIIKHAALTTRGFKVAKIIKMLETAQSVSRERGKTAIDKADMTEAYLRTTSERVNKYKTSDHEKKIVASHEAGHALTLQIMYNIAQKQKDTPWKLPSQVNFITLDPRGYYGGAMYPADSINHEYSFEKIMADIVCDYGGHASEKAIYGYTGSWGISADMEAARCLAESAVVDMGMGVKTGVRNIPRDIFGGISGSASQLENVEDDEELILSTAEKIADKIVGEYKKFIKEFTEKHWEQVGTGECIITAEEFNAELNDWIARQDKDKKESLKKLEKKIVKKMEEAKFGKKAKKK